MKKLVILLPKQKAWRQNSSSKETARQNVDVSVFTLTSP